MLRPEYLRDIAEGSEQIASELHNYLIQEIVKRMMLRIGRGKSYLLTSSDQWRIKVLQDAGYLLEDVTDEIAKYTKLQKKEIREAMEEAGIKSVELDDQIYKAAGLSPVPLWESPELVRIMERNMLATGNEWKNFTRTMANESQRAYITACDLAYNKVMSGAEAYSRAVSDAVESIADNGVCITYPSGHKDTIETATARAVRTGIGQAAGDVALKRMIEMDWDIILVSSHVGARTGDGGENPGNHFWWQGKYYSRSGEDDRFPDFFETTGYGTGEGLCGWNCRHSFGTGTGKEEDNPYIEVDSEENRKIEMLEKKQRALERRIRKTKRAVMGLQTAVENCTDDSARFELQQLLDRKSYLLQEQNGQYKAFCKQHDLRQLSDRLKIAKWKRAQAAKATAAARRYRDARGV